MSNNQEWKLKCPLGSGLPFATTNVTPRGFPEGERRHTIPAEYVLSTCGRAWGLMAWPEGHTAGRNHDDQKERNNRRLTG